MKIIILAYSGSIPGSLQGQVGAAWGSGRQGWNGWFQPKPYWDSVIYCLKGVFTLRTPKGTAPPPLGADPSIVSPPVPHPVWGLYPLWEKANPPSSQGKHLKSQHNITSLCLNSNDSIFLLDLGRDPITQHRHFFSLLPNDFFSP